MKKLVLTLLTLSFLSVSYAQNKRALIVAIDEYAKKNEFTHINSETGSWSSINSAGTDLVYLKAALNRHKFKEENITVLKDKDATKQGIIKAIKKLTDDVNRGDVVMFHYSGHGQQIKAEKVGESDVYNQALVPYDAAPRYKKGVYEGEMHLRDMELLPLMIELRKKIGPKGHLLIGLDMSHPAIDMAADIGLKNKQLAPYVLLSAADKHELNYETFNSENERIGALTYTLSRTLANATSSTTYTMLFNQIKQYLKVKAPRQNPQIKGSADLKLFNGKASPAMSNYTIKKVIDANRLTIEGGTFFGILKDAQVALFEDGADVQFDNPRATGKVINVGDLESEIVLTTSIPVEEMKNLKAYVTNLEGFKLGVKKIEIKSDGFGFALDKKLDTLPLFERVSLIEDDNFIFSLEAPESTKGYALQVWEISNEGAVSLFNSEMIGISDRTEGSSAAPKNTFSIDFDEPQNILQIAPPFYSAYFIATLTPHPINLSPDSENNDMAAESIDIEKVLKNLMNVSTNQFNSYTLENLNMKMYTSLMRVDYLPSKTRGAGSVTRGAGSVTYSTKNNEDIVIAKEEATDETKEFYLTKIASASGIEYCMNDLQEGCADIEVLQPTFLFGSSSTSTNRGAKRILNNSNYEKLNIRGKIYYEDSIKQFVINKNEVNFEKRGRLVFNWEHDVYLKEGPNELVLEVLTNNNNYRQEIIKIDYQPEKVEQESASHLLLIGINDYKQWPKLSNAINDITKVKESLIENYQFVDSNTVVLADKDATKTNIAKALRELVKNANPNDNVLIYFAGHGWYDDLLNEGYWIPVDASDDLDMTSDYLPNSTMVNYIRAINAKHTVLIADACFSGSLYASKNRGVEKYQDNLYKQKSKYVLSSGGLEEVADASLFDRKLSPFAYYFTKFLQDNKSRDFLVSELTNYLIKSVGNNSEQQTIGNPLKNAGDEGGQFLFQSQLK